MSLPVQLNGTRTVTPNNNHHLTVSGVIGETGGSYGLTKTGGGNLTLNGANAYTGPTTFSGGFVYFNSLKNVGGGASSFGAPTTVESGTITNSSRLLYTGGSTATDRALVLTAAIQFDVSSGTSTLTLNGGISGSGSILFRGSGTFVVNGLIGIGANGVGRTDAGTVYLNNPANSFSGALGISDGIISTADIADSGMLCSIGRGTSITFGQTRYPTTGRFQFTGATGGSCNRAMTVNSQYGIHGGIIENTVAGQTLTLGGNVSVATDNQYSPGGVVNAPLTLTGAGNGVLSGVLETRLRVIKTGTGTWTLAGANAYTGTTTVSQGTLLIDGSTAAASAVSVAAGGTLGGTGTVHGVVSFVAGGALAPGNAGIGTLTLADTGAEALTLNGNTLALRLSETVGISDQLAGTLVLNGANIISLSCPAAGAPAGVYTLLTYAATSGGGTLALDRAYPNATLDVGDTSVTLTVTGAGAFDSLVWQGDGTDNAWDTVTANWSAGAYGDNIAVIFDDTGSDSPAVTITPDAVAPYSVTVNSSSKSYTLGGAAITGAGGLTKSGTTALTLNGANTYTGPTTVNAGTLVLGGSLDGSSLTVATNALLSQSAGSVIAGSAVTLTLRGNTTLSGTNTYDGATTVGLSGTPNKSLTVNNNAALGSTAGGTTVFGGDGYTLSRLYLGKGVTVTNEALTVDGASGRSGLSYNQNSGTGTWAGAIACIGAAYIESASAGGTLAIGTDDTTVVTNAASCSISMRGNGDIALNSRVAVGTGNSLLRNDAGTLLINSTNNVWGGTGLSEGTIRLAVSDGLPATTTLTIGKGDKKALCVFDLNGHDQTLAGLADVHYSGTGDTTGTQRILSAAPATLTVSNSTARSFGLAGSSIEGAVSLVKANTGTLTLTGTNSYSGATVVSNGTLAVSAAGTLGNSSTNIIVGGTGTLALSNSDALADTAMVQMPAYGLSTAKIYLESGVSQKVGWLLYGDVFKGVGTYGATGSGAGHIDDTHFSGTGVLNVLYTKTGTLVLLH
jgi:autotransporter-associated beta strand protein